MGYEFDWSVIPDNLGLFLDGAAMTVLVALIVIVTSTVLGLLIAFLRMSKIRLVRYAATAYIEFFRTVPFLVQLFWVYYAIPEMFSISLPSLPAGIIALTLDVAAFTAETFRAGLQSVGRGQYDAAKAIGMGRTNAMFRVILPQAVRRVLPPLGTQWVLMFQDTALLSLIQLNELTFNAVLLQTTSFRTLEVLSFAALLYLAMGYPAAKVVDWLKTLENHTANSSNEMATYNLGWLWTELGVNELRR